MSWEKNTYKEIKSSATPVDMIMQKAATMSQADFIQWLSIHADDLKEREIGLLSKAYFDGLTYEPFDREEQTAVYISNQFKYDIK
jgi:hypothetical protein